MKFKLWLLLASFLAFIPIASAQWYSGGNLHQKSLYDWSRASERNKLATAADWYATAVGIEGVRRLGGLDRMRPKARQLVICVDASVDGLQESAARRVSASEAAASCMILMGAR